MPSKLTDTDASDYYWGTTDPNYVEPNCVSRDGYTPREMAFCAPESISYAEAVGDHTDADRSLAKDRRF